MFEINLEISLHKSIKIVFRKPLWWAHVVMSVRQFNLKLDKAVQNRDRTNFFKLLIRLLCADGWTHYIEIKNLSAFRRNNFLTIPIQTHDEQCGSGQSKLIYHKLVNFWCKVHQVGFFFKRWNWPSNSCFWTSKKKLDQFNSQ